MALELNGREAYGQLFFLENTIESLTGDIDIQIGLTTATADLVLNRNVALARGKTLSLEDHTAPHNRVALSMVDGVLVVGQGGLGLRVGNIEIFQNTIESTAGDVPLILGNINATASLLINRNVVMAAGKTFGLVDTVTGNTATMSVSSGVLNVDGANQLQVGQLKFIDNTIQSITTGTDIQIGYTTDGADLVLNRNVVIAEGKTLTGGGVSGGTYTGNTATISISTGNVISVVNLPNEIIGPVQGIVFDTTHEHVGEDPGTLCWNPNDDTLNIQHTGGVTQQVGQELYVRVSNATGSTITSGTVVRFDGVSINGEAYLDVAPFLANGTFPSLYTLGVATQDIANGAKGVVTTWGKVRDINTTGGAENWAMGDILYANPATAGGLTKVKPTAPNNVVPVAAVLVVSATVGELFVRPTIEQKYSYGQFARTTDVGVAVINTAYAITFNSTETANGVTLGTPTSRLTVDQSGLYQIDVNAQVEIAGNNNATGTMYMWIRKNGTDVANSMRRQGQRGEVPSLSFSYNIVISLAANDYIEVAYAADSTDMRFDATAATAFGPTTAAVLIGVTQIQL